MLSSYVEWHDQSRGLTPKLGRGLDAVKRRLDLLNDVFALCHM
jgi:hypothetical protein